MSRLSHVSLQRRDRYAAANRPARVNVALVMALGLVLPLLYGVALAVAAVVDAWRLAP